MQTTLSDKTVALFFTRGISLQKWDAASHLSREITLYNGLASKYKRVYFFTYGDERDFRYKNQLADNIVIVPKRWKVPNLLYMFLLPLTERKLLKTIDLYKTNQLKGGLAALIAKRLFKKPLIARCGYEWLLASEKKNLPRQRLKLIEHIERRVYEGADHIIVTARNIHDFIVNRFGVDTHKISIIPNYVDTTLFHPMEAEKKSNSLCFVGRFTDQKNLFELLRGVAGTSVSLTLFGEGEQEQALRDLAQELSIDVDFRGVIPNDRLTTELNKHTAFILPSLYEGNPKVLLEAMACGLPVIATDVVGNQELIEHKQNGFLCGTNAHAIHDAIERVLSNDVLMRTMGRHARETIVQDFSLESVLEREPAVHAALL